MTAIDALRARLVQMAKKPEITISSAQLGGGRDASARQQAIS